MSGHGLDRRRFLSLGLRGAGALGGAGVLGLGPAAFAQTPGPGGERPNVLWLVSEDNSPYLGAYGYDEIPTPTLDRLAAEGVRYDNAFATAPVCAPTRFGIITGLEATTCGPAHHHRASGHIPDWLRGFPAYLRDDGYYCTNNAKTDYNAPIDIRDAWDESSGSAHWRERPSGAPFFSVFNFFVTHESQTFPGVWDPLPSGPDPDEVDLPAYHPDAPQLRADRALYYDQMSRLDAQVANRLAQLEADGLAEDTIVFYYGDHGGVLPRSKRSCLDSGLRIPLIVRFPPRWAHLAPSGPGTSVTSVVSQIDLAPTVLGLAGVAAPAHLEGMAFAGTARQDPQRHAFAFRNRMDERYDMSRSARDVRHRYTRNYTPHFPYGQHYDYMWRQLGVPEWERLYHQGRLDPEQAAYWREKPAEELYDLQDDPDEVVNLATDDRYGAVLDELRGALDAHILEVNDNGFIPEGSPLEGYDQSRAPGAYPLAEVQQVADRAIERDPADVAGFVAGLGHDNECVRYWAALGCVMLRSGAGAARDALVERLADPSWSVRVVAAEALCWLGEADRALPVLAEVLLDHEHERVRLQAANALDHIGWIAAPALDAIEAAQADPNKDVEWAAGYTAAVLRGEWPYADGLTIAPPADGSTEVIVRLFNTGQQAADSVQLDLRAPDGWTVAAASPTSVVRLAAGETVEARFTVTAPAGAEGTDPVLRAEAAYDRDGLPLRTEVRDTVALGSGSGDTVVVDAPERMLPGEPSRVTTRFVNRGPGGAVDRVELLLSAPAGWTVEHVSTLRARRVEEGASFEVAWDVTPDVAPPAGAEDAQLTATGSWLAGCIPGTAEGRAGVAVAAGASSP